MHQSNIQDCLLLHCTHTHCENKRKTAWLVKPDKSQAFSQLFKWGLFKMGINANDRMRHDLF